MFDPSPLPAQVQQMSKAQRSPGAPYYDPACPGSLLLYALKRHFERVPRTLCFTKLTSLVWSKLSAIERGLPSFNSLLHWSTRFGWRIFIPILIFREQNWPTLHLSAPPEEGAVWQCYFKRYLAVMEPNFLNTDKNKSCMYWLGKVNSSCE